jgi:hypothetical protein
VVLKLGALVLVFIIGIKTIFVDVLIVIVEAPFDNRDLGNKRRTNRRTRRL